MKKIIACLLILNILIFDITPSYAAEKPVKILLQQQNIIDTNEKAEVIKALNDNVGPVTPKEDLYTHRYLYTKVKDLNIQSPDDFVYGTPYKVYSFPDRSQFPNIQSGANFADLLQNVETFWVTPIYYKDNNDNLIPVNFCTLYNDKDTGNIWKIEALNDGYINGYTSDVSSSPDKLEALLNKNGIKEADFVAHIYIPLLFDAIYVLDNGKEYYIPLFDNYDENCGLKSGNIYDRQQFIKSIGAIFKNYPENYTGGIYEGGNDAVKPVAIKTSVKSQNNVADENAISTKDIISFCSLGLLIAAGFVLYKKIK